MPTIDHKKEKSLRKGTFSHSLQERKRARSPGRVPKKTSTWNFVFLKKTFEISTPALSDIKRIKIDAKAKIRIEDQEL
jgi:hypothetical protein